MSEVSKETETKKFINSSMNDFIWTHNATNYTPMLYGWTCPICGRGNSPYSSTCPCKPIEFKVTC